MAKSAITARPNVNFFITTPKKETAFGRFYLSTAPLKTPQVMQVRGLFLFLGKAPRADRLYSCDLSGGFALHAGDGGGFALSHGYFLVVSSGFT
jgi:hypothetical protein